MACPVSGQCQLSAVCSLAVAKQINTSVHAIPIAPILTIPICATNIFTEVHLIIISRSIYLSLLLLSTYPGTPVVCLITHEIYLIVVTATSI